jgi:hypothetical protein
MEALLREPECLRLLPFSITVVQLFLVQFVEVRILEGQLTIKTNVMFITYYLICFIYCVIMSIRKWNRDVMAGGLGISPGLDSIALLLMCWILAPVDIFLTWVRVYKEAEEARRNQSKNEKVF